MKKNEKEIVCFCIEKEKNIWYFVIVFERINYIYFWYFLTWFFKFITKSEPNANDSSDQSSSARDDGTKLTICSRFKKNKRRRWLQKKDDNQEEKLNGWWSNAHKEIEVKLCWLQIGETRSKTRLDLQKT